MLRGLGEEDWGPVGFRKGLLPAGGGKRREGPLRCRSSRCDGSVVELGDHPEVEGREYRGVLEVVVTGGAGAASRGATHPGKLSPFQGGDSVLLGARMGNRAGTLAVELDSSSSSLAPSCWAAVINSPRPLPAVCCCRVAPCSAV